MRGFLLLDRHFKRKQSLKCDISIILLLGDLLEVQAVQVEEGRSLMITPKDIQLIQSPEKLGKYKSGQILEIRLIDPFL